MTLLSVIRRWHFREQISIWEICRRTGLSRNTIRKYLRLDGVEPKFKVPERPSKLDPFADRLSAWLKTEAKKRRKQKRTLKQLHADLVSVGYDGSYCRVAAFAREWKADRQRELQTTGIHADNRKTQTLQLVVKPRCHRTRLKPDLAQNLFHFFGRTAIMDGCVSALPRYTTCRSWFMTQICVLLRLTSNPT